MDHKPTEADEAFLKEHKFREPNYPYVVLRQKYLEVLSFEKHGEEKMKANPLGKEAYETVRIVNVAGTHRQKDKFEKHFIKQCGGKVITWGKFPNPDSVMVKAISESGQRSPWIDLEDLLKREVGQLAQQSEERRLMEDRIAALEKRNKELEAKGKQGGKQLEQA